VHLGGVVNIDVAEITTRREGALAEALELI